MDLIVELWALVDKREDDKKQTIHSFLYFCQKELAHSKGPVQLDLFIQVCSQHLWMQFDLCEPWCIVNFVTPIKINFGLTLDKV